MGEEGIKEVDKREGRKRGGTERERKEGRRRECERERKIGEEENKR